MTLRSKWAAALAAIVFAGIVSRVGHTGIALFDKHLGDLLYAAMIYAILRLCWITARRSRVAGAAMAMMTGIELFQLTGIAAEMVRSGSPVTRICGRLMGTTFSFVDLGSYAIAIGVCFLADRKTCAVEFDTNSPKYFKY